MRGPDARGRILDFKAPVRALQSQGLSSTDGQRLAYVQAHNESCGGYGHLIGLTPLKWGFIFTETYDVLAVDSTASVWLYVGEVPAASCCR